VAGKAGHAGSAGSETLIGSAESIQGRTSDVAESETEGETGAALDLDSERALLEELAKDPAIGGKITEGTREEARAARGLELRGDLRSPVIREPSGASDFIDGHGQTWDVKSYRSDYPNGYDFDIAMKQIGAELQTGENVILNTSKLSPVEAAELRSGVTGAGWSDRILFWP
jgi:hypothetical protein